MGRSVHHDRLLQADADALDQCLAEATHAQLADCVRRLAGQVARYRSRYGKLASHQATLGPDAIPAESLEPEILLEALGHAGEKAAEASAGAPNKVRLIEQREYARVHVRIPIRVGATTPGVSVPAHLTDLSWGGAALICPGPCGAVGEEIQLYLPFMRDGKDIAITARILRVWERPDGRGVAVRFSSLTSDDDKRLERVLVLLDQKGIPSDQRKYPRLARRLEIEYANHSDWQATLENISQGGISVTLPYPVKLDQSIQVVLSETSGTGHLTLRGRVVNQEPIKFGDTEFHQISLQFEHPSSDLQQSVQSLLRTLAVSTRDELYKAAS